ncbi:hypothetical protein HXX76_000641 [Chlamydomonas incerta]|uniref:Uncharacterized protein n=1 Tax=Chlamydomonas incerta TaxID=51695 RepID=A0A835WEH3_CHLIN|nr:hypothetical protein HXX76_000641 [Chlamydomonas incerta]|eukprot:KAG2446039.1 hypothetical protein HXX76_000641 [Chlamydomonas incerta]
MTPSALASDCSSPSLRASLHRAAEIAGRLYRVYAGKMRIHDPSAPNKSRSFRPTAYRRQPDGRAGPDGPADGVPDPYPDLMYDRGADPESEKNQMFVRLQREYGGVMMIRIRGHRPRGIGMDSQPWCTQQVLAMRAALAGSWDRWEQLRAGGTGATGKSTEDGEKELLAKYNYAGNSMYNGGYAAARLFTYLDKQLIG